MNTENTEDGLASDSDTHISQHKDVTMYLIKQHTHTHKFSSNTFNVTLPYCLI
jgi:hypothetical protein